MTTEQELLSSIFSDLEIMVMQNTLPNGKWLSPHVQQWAATQVQRMNRVKPPSVVVSDKLLHECHLLLD